MDESTFETLAGQTLAQLETGFDEVDPDEVEVSSSDGVLQLELRGGVRVVVNRQRAARQIWLAAVASAWHFDYHEATGNWVSADGDELLDTIARLVREHSGVDVRL